MHRNFMDPMVDAHYTVRDRGAHRLADQPPRHRIGIAIDLHRTIALHAPDQLARRVEGRNPGNRLESFGLGALELVDRRLAGRAMQAHIGDIPRPGFKMRLQGFPALGAIKGEFDKYGDVVSSLARQLNAAGNSVDNLGKRTRIMSRKLKHVEILSDQQAAEKLLGFSGDDAVDGGFEDTGERQKIRLAAR